MAPETSLPGLLQRKLYKTGQTRGADDDDIFQNRVSRASTVLIPYPVFRTHYSRPKCESTFASGYIVLIPPADYFSSPGGESALTSLGLVLGDNALLFYEQRKDWLDYPPKERGLAVATRRLRPLGGAYVARISATTAREAGTKIVEGFSTTTSKGAGIRAYEYATPEQIGACRDQLEALYWLCPDSIACAVAHGMSPLGAEARMATTLARCRKAQLLDTPRMTGFRMLNPGGATACPLCLDALTGDQFFTRESQAAGRETLDITVTQVSLFHIAELRPGVINHVPYNVGWGHHHCNVVAKDAGIPATLRWMETVLARNPTHGLSLVHD